MQQLVLAGGCFWGVEELFRVQPGVVDTEVGYTGGTKEEPTFESHFGHAEALRISYNDTETSAARLLDYFFQIHDPTTLNQQGNDIGSSYRSTIFYADATERSIAEEAIKRNQIYWQRPIVTTLEPLSTFWSAEEYHQDYLRKHPGGYTCHFERKR